MAQARLRILTDDEKDLIHDQTLRVLEEAGIGYNLPEAIDLLAAAGAQVDRQTLRARVPRELVAAALQTVPRQVLLAARDPRRDVVLGDGSLTICSDGTATYMIDDTTGARRPASAADLHIVMRLLDGLPEVDYVWPSVSARDLDPLTANLEIELISLQECAKHLQDEVRGPEFVAPLVDMLEAIAGASLKDRPIFSTINCTVAPLMHDAAMTDASLRLARHGVPVFVMPMPLLGTTAPASLIGTCVVTMAEILSTVVLLQLAAPGCPLVACPEPALADMRTGEYVCGAPEATLIAVACLEMCARYGLPTQAGGVGGDGAFPDYQEGAEGAGSALISVLAGADSLVGFGTLDGAQSFSLAKCVLDNDTVGGLRRLLGGMRVDDESSLIDDILAVGPGGHFLGRRATRRLRASGQMWEPGIFRRGHAARARGPAKLVAEAAARAAEIVSTHAAEPLAEEAARHAAAVIAAYAALAR